MKLLIMLLLLAGCGFNGEQKLTQSGSSYTYVVVRLEYLEQIKELCLEANPLSNFTTAELQKESIANCTLENMKIFNINVADVLDFKNKYCGDQVGFNTFTPEQQADILAACEALKL